MGKEEITEKAHEAMHNTYSWMSLSDLDYARAAVSNVRDLLSADFKNYLLELHRLNALGLKELGINVIERPYKIIYPIECNDTGMITRWHQIKVTLDEFTELKNSNWCQVDVKIADKLVTIWEHMGNCIDNEFNFYVPPDQRVGCINFSDRQLIFLNKLIAKYNVGTIYKMGEHNE